MYKNRHHYLVWQAARPFASAVEGKMSYEDFVWFILSEEDKSSDVSLDYWFRCVDLDCDGCLQPNEMLVSSHPDARNQTNWVLIGFSCCPTPAHRVDCAAALCLKLSKDCFHRVRSPGANGCVRSRSQRVNLDKTCPRLPQVSWCARGC